jgi:hypothetical protein
LQEDFIEIFTKRTSPYEAPLQRSEVEGLIATFDAFDARTNEVSFFQASSFTRAASDDTISVPSVHKQFAFLPSLIGSFRWLCP